MDASVNYHMNNFRPEQILPAMSHVSLYVGDLHRDVVDDELALAFSEFESLVSVKVCRDYWTKESVCYGFLNFNDALDAAEAIRTKNHMLLRGKAIRLMWSARDGDYRKNGIGNVFVKNLGKSVDNGRLQGIFHEYGKIMSSKVAMSEDGSSKGYGFVQFETQVAADAAIKALNGKDIDGKNIYVAPFIPKSVRSLPNPDAPFTNLYVKNLELGISEQQLREMFSKFGEISSMAIPTDEHGSSKCFGFVSFDKPDDAKRAAEAMNGSQHGSKVLFVGRAQKKAERQRILRRHFEEKRKEQIKKFKDCNLYVKNIDDSVNEDMLRELFSQCGEITSVKLMLHRKGVSRGFGFVCFSTPEEANKAIYTFHFYMFHGKPLYVAIAQRKEERQAQLRMRYSHPMTVNGGPLLPPVMTGGYSTPVFYTAPPTMVTHFPPRPGVFYPHPVGLRPGWRGNGYVSPIRPNFETYRSPVNGQFRGRINGTASLQVHVQPRYLQRNGRGMYQSNGKVSEANTDTSLPQHVLGSADLSKFVADADSSQQKNILSHRLFLLVRQLQPDLATKITGELLKLDIKEILLLLDSPSSLEEKVNEVLSDLKIAETKDSSQESAPPVLPAEVAVN